MRHASALLIALALLSATVACSSSAPVTGSTPQETAYLSAARDASSTAGFTWTDEMRSSALDFGSTVCADWQAHAENTREQNVEGAKASVRLTDQNDANKELIERYVDLASQHLCPVP